MKLPFVWMFHKGERPSWGQTVGRDRRPRHPFPDSLARSRRCEGSNHGGCPASSRSLLPAGQLRGAATHPWLPAHELGAASLHVVLHMGATSCCQVCFDPDNSASTEPPCAVVAPSLCRSSCRFARIRSRQVPTAAAAESVVGALGEAGTAMVKASRKASRAASESSRAQPSRPMTPV